MVSIGSFKRSVKLPICISHNLLLIKLKTGCYKILLSLQDQAATGDGDVEYIERYL